MYKKIIGVIVSIVIGILIGVALKSETATITGFLASMLTFIYFEMPDKKQVRK